MITATKTISRPNDTTAYDVNDVINATTAELITFAGLESNQGIITKLRLTTSNKLTTATCRLHLYSQELAVISDNQPNTVLYSNLDNYIGSIDLPPLRTEGLGSNGAYAIAQDSIIYNLLNGSKIYGVLQTLSAFTPLPSQEFKLEITVIDNI
jgi:hypothetical protein